MWKIFFIKKYFKEHLINNGVKSDHIIFLELDDFNNNSLLNPLNLNDYIRSQIIDDENYEQERKSLINIKDSFKKIIIPAEYLPIRRDEKGIVIMGIIDFLLNDNSLDK